MFASPQANQKFKKFSSLCEYRNLLIMLCRFYYMTVLFYQLNFRCSGRCASALSSLGRCCENAKNSARSCCFLIRLCCCFRPTDKTCLRNFLGQAQPAVTNPMAKSSKYPKQKTNHLATAFKYNTLFFALGRFFLLLSILVQ